MSTSGRKGKPEAQAVRERLLQSALDLFTERGYASTSVREIVGAAGVTKPVLYYYFKSKKGIYLELLTKPFSQLEKIIDEALCESGTFRDRIAGLYSRIFTLFVEKIKEARLMYSIYYGPPQGAPFIDFEAYHLKMRELTGKMLKEALKRGEIKNADADTTTWLLIGTLNLAMEEQLCHRNPEIDLKGLLRMLDLIFLWMTSGKKKRKGKR